MDFTATLLLWYEQNKRNLPWRNTSDPYRIWVSEVILQQTRVAQGLGYYLRFVEAFPNVRALAEAPLDAVMKAWQGLGYYTRARNLHRSAQIILKEHDGVLPGSYSELIKIPGLGPYSAAAVASFAFKEAVPALDGNVYRILARAFGVFTSPETSQGKKEFYKLALELIDRKHPDRFNQAIIDFGAMVCVPRSPGCSDCVFATICYAYRNNLIDRLPVKGRKVIPRNRYFNYLMINHKGFTFIRRREESDIWNSLYEFPLIETEAELPVEDLLKTGEWVELLGKQVVRIYSVSPNLKHQLSHLNINTRFVIVGIDRIPYSLKKSYKRIAIADLQEYSVPRVIDSYMAAEPVERYFTKPEAYL